MGICAGVLVQYSLQPTLQPVYRALLDAHQKDFVLRPASLYVSTSQDKECITFEELAARVHECGEVAIGVHKESERHQYLNPPRNQRFELDPDDRVVVLGESL